MAKLLTIVGARPQFIKAAAISRLLSPSSPEGEKHSIDEILVHTGQHFDKRMSADFFEELQIPEPQYNLEIAGLSHGAMTGRMLEGIEKIILKEEPRAVLVYGDTNSTIAGALAAVKLGVPVAHVEAGLRSFNLAMPEEHNRKVTDLLSDTLFCPTETAVEHLRREGRTEKVYLSGDVMFDVALHYRNIAVESISLDQWGLKPKKYVLATIHRAENTDDPERLENLLKALRIISKEYKVILPLHPRTVNILKSMGNLSWLDGLQVLEPTSYLNIVRLQLDSKAILTDSGGMQKEAFFHRVPCITLRNETEWPETVDSGWNTVVGADVDRTLAAFAGGENRPKVEVSPYGNGRAAQGILEIVSDSYFQ